MNRSRWQSTTIALVLLAALVSAPRGAAAESEAKLVTSDGAPGDNFGFAVAIRGDRALVGAPGDDAEANRVSLAGRISAPYGEIRLGRWGVLDGWFCADRIRLDRNVTATLPGAGLAPVSARATGRSNRGGPVRRPSAARFLLGFSARDE